MDKIMTTIKQKSLSVKDRIRNLVIRYRYVSGITVIELVLILVIICTCI